MLIIVSIIFIKYVTRFSFNCWDILPKQFSSPPRHTFLNVPFFEWKAIFAQTNDNFLTLYALKTEALNHKTNIAQKIWSFLRFTWLDNFANKSR